MAADDDGSEGQAGYRYGSPALRAFLVIGMFGLLVFALLGVSATANGKPGWLAWTIVAGGLEIVLVAVHVRIFHYRPTKQQRMSDHNVVGINYKELRDDTGPFSAKLDHEHLAMFVEAIVDPASIRERVVEEIRPLKRALRQSVSANLALDSISAGYVLYPIMMPKKGALQDDLDVQVDGDQPVATLSYSEYLLLAAKAIHSLLSAALPHLGKDDQGLVQRCAEDAFVAVALRGVPTDEDIEKQRKCTGDLEKIAAVLNAKDVTRKLAELVQTVASMTHKLSTHYAIVAVLPLQPDSSGRAVIKYERYLIPSLARTEVRSIGSLREWLQDHLRTLLGARPISLELSLANSATARSYHLLVFGPDGMHLGWQEMHGDEDVFKSNHARTIYSPYRRFRKRLGQAYMHLYMRSIKPHSAEKLRVYVRFYETPPGSMAPTMMAAGACAALVYIAGAVVSASGKTFGSDFPALVLAFPAIAATLVGFTHSTNQLLGGTVASKFSSFLVVVMSVSASGLYMAQTNGFLMHKWEWVNFLFMNLLWWQILSLTAVVNFVFALYVWVTRTFSYYWLATRPSKDAEAIDGSTGGVKNGH